MELTIIAVAVVFVVLAGLAFLGLALAAACMLSSKISREEEERKG